MSKTKIEKNPLSVLLGAYFARERSIWNETSKNIAQQIPGISEAFYRMIESGAANLHPSNFLKIIKVFSFSGSSIEVGPFCKYLTAVQLVQASLPSHESFNSAIEELIDCDISFAKLFSSYKDLWERVEKGNDIREILDSNPYYLDELKKFLQGEYEHFDFDDLRDFGELNTILDVVPSFYLDFAIENLKNDLKILDRLPIQITQENFWEWEKKNANDIEKVFVLTMSVDSVVGKMNLENYNYELLRNNKLKEYKIFIADSKSNLSEKEIFDLFQENFKEIIIAKKKESERGRVLKDELKKISIKIPTEIREIDFILKDNKKKYEAVIVYIYKGGPITFLADLNGQTITPVKNVAYKRSKEIYESIQKLK